MQLFEQFPSFKDLQPQQQVGVPVFFACLLFFTTENTTTPAQRAIKPAITKFVIVSSVRFVHLLVRMDFF